MTEATGSVDAGTPANAGGAPGAVAAPAAWHTTDKFDAETRGWIENRGLHQKAADEALAAAIATARNAEKKMGVPENLLLKLPANMDEPGAMDPIYDRFGRPKGPEGYEFKAPENDPVGAEFTTNMAATFHKAGLSKAQADAVFKAIDEFSTKVHETELGAETTRKAGEMAKLQTEWGDLFGYNKLLAQEAVKALGVTADEIKALTAAMESDAAVVRLFNRLGQKRGGEAPFLSSDNPIVKYGASTPEAARAKMAELRADPEWQKKYMAAKNGNDPNNSAVVKEFRALAALAARDDASNPFS